MGLESTAMRHRPLPPVKAGVLEGDGDRVADFTPQRQGECKRMADGTVSA